ncbi:hypothetical protein CJF31_00011781 [Rutstroemia sp. NJR-2017a BVV2]|nr:hypothetical protein CJF31_00011781 [Rutstroemia sp. NJR-2017a BVV2]
MLVPQGEPQQPILLDPIVVGGPSYNYNSGTPTSAASSQRAPSVSSQTSILSSPPPSFHSVAAGGYFNNFPAPPQSHSNSTTPFPPFVNYPPPPSFHSRSSTPRPTPSSHTIASNGSGIELWGVAPSTITATTTDADDVDVGRDGPSPLLVLKDLRTRVERLEESIGKLLDEKHRRLNSLQLENEELRTRANESSHHRSNCCVTFTDASTSLEERLVSSGMLFNPTISSSILASRSLIPVSTNAIPGSNCCVRFKSSSHSQAQRREKQRKEFVVAGALVMFALIIFAFSFVSTPDRNRKNGEVHFGTRE